MSNQRGVNMQFFSESWGGAKSKWSVVDFFMSTFFQCDPSVKYQVFMTVHDMEDNAVKTRAC